MKSYFKMWPGLIDSSTCNAIKKEAMTIMPSKGTVGFRKEENSNIRKADVRWIKKVRHNNEFDSVHRLIETYIQRANQECFGFDISHEKDDIQFTEYHEWDESFYNWHHDVFWFENLTDVPYSQRKLSFVMQLDDPKNYDGSDFEFHSDDVYEMPNKDQLREQGTILVFPSFFRHRVTPITRGSRRSLVCWQRGPLWR